MRTFNFTLLAALSSVAMIGVTLLGNRAPEYVPLTIARGGSDPTCRPTCADDLGLPGCAACIFDSQLSICTGVCDNFRWLPSCARGGAVGNREEYVPLTVAR